MLSAPTNVRRSRLTHYEEQYDTGSGQSEEPTVGAKEPAGGSRGPAGTLRQPSHHNVGKD